MQHPPSVMVTVFLEPSQIKFMVPPTNIDNRKQVCDWIEQHKERYEGFVEDVGGKAGKRGGPGVRDKGKGLEAHLRCMRENGKFPIAVAHDSPLFTIQSHYVSHLWRPHGTICVRTSQQTEYQSHPI